MNENSRLSAEECEHGEHADGAGWVIRQAELEQDLRDVRIFAVFLIADVANPSPDPLTMLILGGCGALVEAAEFIARRGRNQQRKGWLASGVASWADMLSADHARGPLSRAE